MPDNLPIRVAIVEANNVNMTRQMEDHEQRDTERFERTFEFIRGMKAEILESMDKMNKKIGDLDTKVDTLWDLENQRKGAMKISRFIGHGISGLVGGTIALVVELVKK